MNNNGGIDNSTLDICTDTYFFYLMDIIIRRFSHVSLSNFLSGNISALLPPLLCRDWFNHVLKESIKLLLFGSAYLDLSISNTFWLIRMLLEMLLNIAYFSVYFVAPILHIKPFFLFRWA